MHAATIATLRAQRRRMALHFAASGAHSPSMGIQEVAAHLQMSTRQLQRAFKEGGTGIASEIRALRIERAQVLLRSSPAMSITDIALNCGFDSLATFYRSFKALSGVTASAWRRNTPR